MNGVKAGRRNSAKDQVALQKAHDAIVEAGAACGGDGESKAVSLMERHEQVYRAFDQQFRPPPVYDMYGEPVREQPRPCLLDVYDEYVICRLDQETFQVAYAVTDEGVQFAEQGAWVKVEKEWVAKRLEQVAAETVVHFGNEVKALGGGKVGGYLVSFSSDADPDLTGDFFTAKTDFGSHEQTLAFYQHGMDPKLARRVLDPAAKMRVDEVGVWVEAQLQLRDDYERAVYGLAEKGKLGWSSGTAAHLVEREPVGKAMWIKRWPLGLDASLTPTPAEPRNSVVALKALAATPLSLETEARAAVPVIEVVDTEEDEAMSEEQVKGLQGKMDAFEAKMADFSDVLSKIMKHIEDAPPVRNAGYVTQDGGAADPQVKSFGDFLMAVYRGDARRLKSIYGALKDQSEGVGSQGGFLVPREYSQQLLQVTAADNQIVSRVTRVPVSVESGDYPALDQFTAPTVGVGETAFAGGVTVAKTAEGGALTETQARFKMLSWKLNKIGGYTEVSNELIADSPTSIEALLGALFRVAVSAKKEYYVLRGTGNGEPLGILNASCAIGITPATNNEFDWADVLSIRSRFKKVMGSDGVWIIHPSIWPDIGTMEVSTGSGGVYQANLATAIQQGLAGFPILESEHLPQANSTAVILADLKSYALFEKGELSIAFSEHAAFTADKGTWRFTERLDGKPWLINAITLADPTGSYTVSPFVYLND